MEYTSRNIEEDEGALDELERMGTMTAPVVVIGSGADKEVVGLDWARLERTLGL